MIEENLGEENLGEQTPTNQSTGKKKIFEQNQEVFDNINFSPKSFSRKLEFVGLDYEAKREKVEDITDELINILYKEKFSRRNTFMTILKEIIKNSADHSNSDTNVFLDISRNEKEKKIVIQMYF